MTHPKDQIDTEALRLCAPAPGTDDEPALVAIAGPDAIVVRGVRLHAEPA